MSWMHIYLVALFVRPRLDPEFFLLAGRSLSILDSHRGLSPGSLQSRLATSSFGYFWENG